jgi:hypothetical protein
VLNNLQRKKDGHLYCVSVSLIFKMNENIAQKNMNVVEGRGSSFTTNTRK